MKTDILIIGQGLCGSWLSYFLEKENVSFVVMDDAQPNSASRVASGVINPVTGRRIVKTWMIDDLLPFAWQHYSDMGTRINAPIITQKNIIEFFTTPQMQIAFENRMRDDDQYVSLPQNENEWRNTFQYDFGFGTIDPCYHIDLQAMLIKWRNHLISNEKILEEKFELHELQLTDETILYKNIIAKKIIFCDGIAAFNNPWFKLLPYGLNKGEALLVEINELSDKHIFKKGFSLVPWRENIFWLGSTYLWEFDNNLPTPGFKQFAENWLKQTVKLPYKIIDHLAAIRPATLERRPFAGFHPSQKNIGILNGMGTKGCSLAPWFASELVQNICYEKPIMPLADVNRFQKIMQRKQ